MIVTTDFVANENKRFIRNRNLVIEYSGMLKFVEIEEKKMIDQKGISDSL